MSTTSSEPTTTIIIIISRIIPNTMQNKKYSYNNYYNIICEEYNNDGCKFRITMANNKYYKDYSINNYNLEIITSVNILL